MTNPKNNEPKTQPCRKCYWGGGIDTKMPCPDCKYSTRFVPNNENWRERFEELFDREMRDEDGIFPNEKEERGGVEIVRNVFIPFIQALLKEQKDAIIKECQKKEFTRKKIENI